MCMIKEVWRDIPNYEGLYQVSTLGNVKSLNYNHTGKEKIMKQSKDKYEYLKIRLCKENKVKNFRVHRLVALAFLENPNNLPCVNHKDENKQNNHVNNLEICSYLYNNNYGSKKQRMSESLKGKPKSEEMKRNLSKARRKPILQFSLDNVFIREWDSTKTASKELNLKSSSICMCCKGKTKTCGGYKWVYKSDYKPTNTQLELQFD